MGFIATAHQPDLSTSLFSTTKDGKHILQITSALTAFKGEVEFIYSEDSYKSPEEFKDLVIQHFRENSCFIVNETDTLSFSNPMVILGHETKLVVEVIGLPEKINSFYYRNGIFKDMPRNKMALLFMIEGFPKDQLILDTENEHSLHLELNNGLWERYKEPQKTGVLAAISQSNSFPLLLLIPLLIGGYLFYRNRDQKKSKI